MRMSDIVGSLDLSIYTQVALVLFVGVFAAVLARTYSRRQRAEMGRAARLPLADDDRNDRR